MVGSKPRKPAPPSELDNLVTLQISVVCEMPDERSRAAAEELLATVAQEFLLRCLLISTRMPIGETMLRVGLQQPVRKKVEPNGDQ